MAATIDIARAEASGAAETQSEVTLNGAPGLRLFTAAEYQRLADLGILDEDERVELIEGRILRMAPKNTGHAFATSRAHRCFANLLGERAVVRGQDPILLNDYSEPEPDLVLAKPPDERYIERHPTPKDILLVMEIADSTLASDRSWKGPLFAKHGIIQFCLLNLRDRELEDYRDPGPDGYRSKQTYNEGQSFRLVAFPKISIRVGELLPPLKRGARRRRK